MHKSGNQLELEKLLMQQANKLMELNVEPELEFKKIDCLVNIYTILKEPSKLI